jgi:peptidoglycan glycosyltransferase
VSVPIQIGFGQGPLAVTPLQMTLVASAIANGGVMMKPHLIADYEFPNGGVYYRTKPEVWKRACSAKAAGEVKAMMASVVEAGTGTAAQLPGIHVAGKTGTAENPHGKTHAWFICMAPADKPQIAMAVLVEEGGVGGTVAAPIARQVLASYFGVKAQAK